MRKMLLFLGAITFLSSYSPLKSQVYTVSPTKEDVPLCWRELAASAYDYGACSSHKEPKALLNSRYELQARTSGEFDLMIH